MVYLGDDGTSPQSITRLYNVDGMSKMIIIEESGNIPEDSWDYLGSILDKLRDQSQAPEDPQGRADRRE